jgi:hypothetical protein
MKKFCLSVMILLTLLHKSEAQKVRFAVFADPLISYFKTDLSRISPDGSRAGINFGLMMDKFFAEHYAFTTGISLQSMGGTLKYVQGKNNFSSSNDTLHSLPDNTSVKYKLQYLHIPIALKLRTTEIGYFTYFVQLGLDPMINVKANADIPSLSQKNIGVGGEIRLFYMGYHIGAGLEYRILGNTKLLTGLTYSNGFSDVTSNNGNSAEKTTMNWFELRIGIIF